MNYSLRLALVPGSYAEQSLYMIDAAVTAVDGRFLESAAPYEVVAHDAVNSVSAFMAFLSPNGKELHAFFTTDAFTVFPGTFDLDFGRLGTVLGTIPNVDIATLIPLSPSFAALGLPNADNAWRASL
jgi:hypothetical protein